MPRVSAERIFKSYHPRATIEAQRTTSGERYHLVRTAQRAFYFAGEGATPAKAWADACAKRGFTTLKGT